MAVSAREILLIFRAQNYASQAIKRVGADVGGISRATQLSNQRQQLQVNRNRLLTSRNIAANELASLQTGSRRQALDIRRASLASQYEATITRTQSIEKARLALQADQIENQQRIANIASAQARGQDFVGTGLGRMTSTEAMKAAKFDQQALATQAGVLNRQLEAQTAALAKLEASFQKLDADEAAFQQRQAVLTQEINNTTRALELNNAKMAQNARAINMLKFENFASGAAKVEHAGRVIQMFGLVTGAAMGYAADQAAKFNTQAVIAATQSTAPGRNTVAQVQKNAAFIQNQIQSLLTKGRTTASSQELTQGAYDIYSGLTLSPNQKTALQQGMDILRQFNRVLTANYGMVTFNQVTQAGITLMNDFGVSVKQLPSALNTMQAAVRYGRMNMEQFLSTFNQAAPASKAAHYSFQQMASSIAFLSRKFPSVTMAATGYARLLEILSRNADKFNKAGYQITNKAGTQLLPLNDIIANILRKNPQLAQGGTQLQNFFKQITGQTGYIQSRRVFTFLAQDLGGYQRMVRNVTSDQNELNKSIAAAQKSPGVRWAEFVQQLHGIVLELGTGAIPAFKAFAAPIEAAIRWFDNLNPRTQKFIGYMTAMVGIGALVGGSFLAIAGGIARIGAVLASTVGAKGLTTLGEEAGAVQIRFALMLGIVGLLAIAFIRFHSQTMAVVNALGGMRDVLGMIGGAAAAIAIVKIIGLMGKLTKSVYAFRDAEVAADAVNPFLLIAAAIGILTVYAIEHWHTISRGWEVMVNGIYKFFVDYFINPVIKAIDYMADAWNATLGHIFGGIGKLNQLSDRGPFNIIYPEKPNPAQEAYKKAIARGYIGGTAGMGESTRDNPFGYLKKSGLIKLGYDPFSYGRGMSTRQDPSGFLKLGSAADKAFRKTKAYLDQINKATNDNKKFTDQASKAAAAYGTTATLSFQKAYKAYVDALAIAKKFPKNLDDQIKAQQALSNLEAVASKQQIAAAKKAADATVASNNAIKQSTQETFQNILQGIQSMYNNFLSTEQNIFGQLFQGPFMNSPQMQNFLQWGGKTTGQQLTRDLRSQLHQFRQFHGALNNLQRRGAPSALIQQLMQLGPSALPQIQALVHMSKGQLDNYFKLFRQSQQLIHKQTMKDLQEQLKEYRKFGRSVALAIVAGLRDENVAVTNALRRMIRQMFPGLPGSGQHHPAAAGAHGGDVHHHDHYHVTTHKGADVGTQIRHAAFRSKNKHRRRKFKGDRYGN